MNKKKVNLFFLFLMFILLISGCSPKQPPPNDTTPPQVSITNPQNGQTVSGIVTIQAQANDNLAVTKVEFYVDNAKAGEDTSSPYEYSWDTTQVNDGTHTITVKAYDAAGNKSSASISVYVYNPIPGPSYVEAIAITYYEGIYYSPPKVIEKILQNKKLHPKLKEAIKDLSSKKINRSNVKNFSPFKALAPGKTSTLPTGYHIEFFVWWGYMPNATEYHVYLSDDGINFVKILDTPFTNFLWWYADQDLGLEPGVTYKVKVTATVEGKETLATVGSWDVKILDPVILTYPPDRALNMPRDSLYFSWENAPHGAPSAWDIYVYNEWDETGWYYSSENFQNSISYNYDGSAYSLYPGATYRWYVEFYDTYKYSVAYGDYYYFTLSLSPNYLFQTSASDYVKISWTDINNDLNLYVTEPDGNTYACYGITPNGIFVGNEPSSHNFNFEQYSFFDINSATPGDYQFYVSNSSFNTEYVTVTWNLKGTPGSYNLSIDPYETYYILLVTIPGEMPQIKILPQNKKVENFPKIQKQKTNK